MKIEMLDTFTVDINVKLTDKECDGERVTMDFLNGLSLALDDASKYNDRIGDTYNMRVAGEMSKAIYAALKNAGYYKEGR